MTHRRGAKLCHQVCRGHGPPGAAPRLGRATSELRSAAAEPGCNADLPGSRRRRAKRRAEPATTRAGRPRAASLESMASAVPVNGLCSRPPWAQDAGEPEHGAPSPRRGSGGFESAAVGARCHRCHLAAAPTHPAQRSRLPRHGGGSPSAPPPWGCPTHRGSAPSRPAPRGEPKRPREARTGQGTSLRPGRAPSPRRRRAGGDGGGGYRKDAS